MSEANTSADLPKGKQTALALYLTAKEAYEMWKAAPGKVKIIDVRTPEEYLFVGHPTMAWKIAGGGLSCLAEEDCAATEFLSG